MRRGHGYMHMDVGKGRGVGSPGSAVTGGCVPIPPPLCGCWELNASPQQEL